MISILVYPNITFAKDLEADSYVVVLSAMIRELNAVRSDLEFTILSPAHVEALDFENTHQVGISLPTYPNTMRTHFDALALKDQLRWKERSYDVVWSHLPEQTLALRNLLYNATNERPAFVGYTHWTEFEEITTYPESMIDANLLGLHSMLRCGINTQAQKEMVLDYADRELSQKRVARLDEILVPMHLGAEDPPAVDAYQHEPATIVFNHRPHAYKSYPWFLDRMDELWAERQDFRVWVPLANSSDREYVRTGTWDRKGYLEHLAGCRFGVGAAQKYAGWSVSVTDGYSVGVPYLLHEEPSYEELGGPHGRYYSSDEQFLAGCRAMLDTSDPAWSHRRRREAFERFDELRWKHRIQPISEMLDLAVDSLPAVGDASKRYPDLLAFVRRRGTVSKLDATKEMGWGVGIPWTPYRNRLRGDGIEVTRDQLRA